MLCSSDRKTLEILPKRMWVDGKPYFENTALNSVELKNLSWYRYHIVDVHKLEKSRWSSMPPWEKVNEIEEFLILKKMYFREY